MTDEFDFESTSNEQKSSKYIIKALKNTLTDGTYFTLSQQVVTSLDILPKLKPDLLPDIISKNRVTSRSNATVFCLLNKCRTQTGQRLLAYWLQNPLKSLPKINTRLEIVNEFVENTALRNICHNDYLRKIPDLIRLAYKIHIEKCTLSDLMKVYTSRHHIKNLCKSFSQVHDFKPESVEQSKHESVRRLFSWADTCCNDLKEFVKLIEDSIDLNTVDESGDYMLKSKTDDDLSRVMRDINDIQTRARSQLLLAASDCGLEADKTIKLETDADKGFALKVTKQNEQFVRGIAKYEQLSLVKKDGYRFTCPHLDKLSRRYVSAKQEYNELSKEVIHEIISKATIYDKEVLEFSMAITVIDVYISLAVVSSQNGYVKPLMMDSQAGKIHLESMRHPCIEQQPDIDNYVPNSLSMSRNDKMFYIITGPNMGGKSTFIKSVAINVVLAQCGCLVPADMAKISIVDGIFTRVGAGDKQIEGISTFMEEMMDMSTILNEANENSLVIIDELGRGTSTFDGFGIAYAISKNLATKIKCYTLFATHFHELTELEDEVPTVGNLHVKAYCQEDKLTMLYSVDKGVCDESYGIYVAQYTKFPENVIQAAKQKLGQLEDVPGFESKRQVREFVRECVREHKKPSLAM